MQNQQEKIEYDEFAPSFSCYSSDSKASRAVAKVIQEEQNGVVLDDDFEFSLSLSDEEGLLKEADSRGWTVFKRDLLINDREITTSLGKLPIDESEDSSSYSSSEISESESPHAGRKYKKCNSTGSGSKRWILRYLLRWSNSEGKEPMVLLTSKQKRNAGEVSKVGGPWKAHEQFYAQKRAGNEVRKRKSYLPYKTDLVGLFASINGTGKMLPF